MTKDMYGKKKGMVSMNKNHFTTKLFLGTHSIFCIFYMMLDIAYCCKTAGPVLIRKILLSFALGI